MKRKAVSRIVMTILLASIFIVAFGIARAKAAAFPSLWNYSTGSRVYTVLTSPNNEYAVAGSDDRNVYCLDLATGQKVWNYYTGEWSERVLISIYSLSISPDSKYAIAGTANNTYAFNLNSGEKIWSYPTGETWSVSVTSDSKYVIAGSHNGNIYKLNITDGTETWRYQAGHPVYRVSLSSNNQYIAAGLMLASTGLIVLDLSGNPVWNYHLNGDVDSLMISPDSKYVIAGSGGNVADSADRRGRIYGLNLTNGQQIWNHTATGPFDASNIPITSICVSSDSRFVVAGTGNGITSYLDIFSGRLIWEYDTGSYMWDVDISPNGEYVVAAAIGSHFPAPEVPPNVFLLKTSDGSKIWNYSTPVTSISISPNSKTIVVGSYRNVYAFESPSPAPPVVTAKMHIAPYTLNLGSKGKWITVYVQLPEAYDGANIDASSILLNGTVLPVLDPKYDFVTNSSEYLVDHNNDEILERMVRFDRAAITSWIYESVGMPHNVSLTMTGELTDGTLFEGSVTIRVLWAGQTSPLKR